MSVQQFAQKISTSLGVPVKYSLPQKEVSTVAVIGGSAGDFWEELVNENIDVLLTGEASHHNVLDAINEDKAIVVAGHWGTEVLVLDYLVDKFSQDFENVEFIKANSSLDPWKYFWSNQ